MGYILYMTVKYISHILILNIKILKNFICLLLIDLT